MNARLVEIRETLMDLPDEERELLAFDLFDSLPEENAYNQRDRQEWDTRLADLKSGKVKGLSIDDFVKKVRSA